MSFGLEIFNSQGQRQLSTEAPIYRCIYSGTLSDDFWIMRSKKVGDIVAITYLSGSVGGKAGGVGLNHRKPWWDPASPLRLYGTHRVCVFRATSFASSQAEFGLEVFNEDGTLSFSSDLYPLILIDSPANSTYSALVFSGVSTDYRVKWEGDGMFLWDELHICRFVKEGGVSLQTNTYNVTTWNSAGISKMEVNTPPRYVDVSNIPLNYDLGVL